LIKFILLVFGVSGTTIFKIEFFQSLVIEHAQDCKYETIVPYFIKDAVPEFLLQPDFCKN